MTAITSDSHTKFSSSEPRMIVAPAAPRRLNPTAALFVCIGITLALLTIATMTGAGAAHTTHPVRDEFVSVWFAGVAFFAAWFVSPPA